MRGRQIQAIASRTAPQCLDFGEWFFCVPVADPAAGTHPYRAGFLDNR